MGTWQGRWEVKEALQTRAAAAQGYAQWWWCKVEMC